MLIAIDAGNMVLCSLGTFVTVLIVATVGTVNFPLCFAIFFPFLFAQGTSRYMPLAIGADRLISMLRFRVAFELELKFPPFRLENQSLKSAFQQAAWLMSPIFGMGMLRLVSYWIFSVNSDSKKYCISHINDNRIKIKVQIKI